VQDSRRFQSAPLREGRRTVVITHDRPRDHVSIRAPARGATADIQLDEGELEEFQSAPLREGRRGSTDGCDHPRCRFNPRPCARATPENVRMIESSSMFQSAPLREGRLVGSSALADFRKCFNPRPCARGDLSASRRTARCRVSIRAPARGATRADRPVKTYAVSFNPRPCARGDGATIHPSGKLQAHHRFNPRPCARGDEIGTPVADAISAFQSAPLREGRPDSEMIRQASSSVSIRAPARGATPRQRRGRIWQSRFNPRPCARGDSGSTTRNRCPESFNPRPCARGDLEPVQTIVQDHGFQSAPLREGRLS